VFFGCPFYVLLAHLCFVLLVFVGTSWLWSIVVHQLLLAMFIGACWHLLAMFCCCLLALPSYALLVVVGVH
jgi:hypothetical protein